MKKIDHKNLLISVLLFLNVSASAKLRDYLSWERIKEIVINEVASQNISTSPDIFDGDIVEGVTGNLGYKYQVEPSFIEKEYIRVDRWRLKLNLNPGNFIDGITPISIGLSKGQDIIFIRNFKSQVKALLAIPYSIHKFPYDADSAIKRLNAGDYVSFPAEMTLSVGASISKVITNGSGSGSIGAFVQSKFAVHIYMKENNQVRVKLVTDTRVGLTAGVGASTNFTVVDVKLINDQIKGLVDLNLLKYNYQNSRGKQYIVDYEFDLNNENARKAFDAIIKPTLKFNLQRVLVSSAGLDAINNKLVSDITLAEELHKKKDGVHRLFKGFNNFKYKSNSLKIGAFISSYSKGKSYYRNKITIEDEDGEVKKFFFPNTISFYEEKLKILAFKRKDTTEVSLHGLVSLDNDGVPKSYSDVGMSYRRVDRVLYRGEWRKLKRFIVGQVPREILKDIPLDRFDFKISRHNSRLDLRILFKENAFDRLKNISFEDVKAALEEIIKERQQDLRILSFDNFERPVKNKGLISSVTGIIRNTFAKSIFNILTSPRYDASTRLEKFVNLPSDRMFRKYGLRLILKLIPERDWREVFYMSLDLSSTQKNQINFEYGKQKYSELYKHILTINRNFQDPSEEFRILYGKR